MDWVKLTDEFNSVVYDVNHTENNYFITGKAGTGKSTLLQYLNATLTKKCILLAPTGRAAINIGGQTLHSFFYLDPAVLQPKDYKNKKLKKLKNIDIIIIDEISMVRADILDSINEIMKNTLKNNLPFGGKQVIMFGDPFQLPPVVPNNEEVYKYFNEYYNSPYFFDSKAYSEAEIISVELTKVFRQKDEYLINILNRFRNDSYSYDDLQEINSRVKKKNLEDNKIIITPYRKKAEKINEEGLESLPSNKKYFRAKISGSIKTKSLPVPETLVLKKGAKVMFVRNNNPFWVNGSLGTIEDIFRDELLYLGITCLEALPPKPKPISKAFDIYQGVNGTIKAKVTQEGVEQEIYMANHSNNSASYVYRENDNGMQMLMDDINADKFREEMKTSPGGFGAWKKLMAVPMLRKIEHMCIRNVK